MPPNAIELPPEAAHALARGQPVRAIKLLRQATGLSLKDAKDVVDVAAREQRGARALGRMTGVDQPGGASAGFVLPPDAAAAVAQGRFIEAIALLRGANPQLDLKSAQAAIDDYLHPPSESASPPARSKRHVRTPSARVPTVVAGDSGSALWLLALVLLVLAAVLAWWLGGGA